MQDLFNTSFKRKFVINLDRRPDRMKIMKMKLQAIGVSIDSFERFSAIDGRELRPFFPDKTPKTLAIKGCLLSHFNIWFMTAHDPSLHSNDLILVLEDDVNFESQFNNLFPKFMTEIKKENESNKEKKMFYVGGQFNPSYKPPSLDPWVKKGDYLYYRPTDLYMHLIHPAIADRTTHFLILNKEMCKALCFLYQGKIQENYTPVDTVLHQTNRAYKDFYFYDCFPHVVWSPYEKDTDIQKEKDS